MNSFQKVVIFDLDDTLLPEIEFLESAYLEIAKSADSELSFLLYSKMIQLYKDGEDVFEYLVSIDAKLTKDILLQMYRNHIPSYSSIESSKEVLELLKGKGYFIGLITDGRSVTQRNKLKSSGLQIYFEDCIISEEFGFSKPSPKNFEYFSQYNGQEYYYIADNPKKDFVAPNALGWKTICVLDKGTNIHSQDFNLPAEYLPQFRVKELRDIIGIID